MWRVCRPVTRGQEIAANSGRRLAATPPPPPHQGAHQHGGVASGKCEQCRVCSRRRRLNTDFCKAGTTRNATGTIKLSRRRHSVGGCQGYGSGCSLRGASTGAMRASSARAAAVTAAVNVFVLAALSSVSAAPLPASQSTTRTHLTNAFCLAFCIDLYVRNGVQSNN